MTYIIYVLNTYLNHKKSSIPFRTAIRTLILSVLATHAMQNNTFLLLKISLQEVRENKLG